MKKTIILLILSVLFVFSALAQHPSQDPNWQMVFGDNFDTFNIGLWHRGHAIHGVEPQHYIHNNVTNANGKLVLTTQKENYQCTQSNCNCGGGTFSYTSGQIASNKRYGYGYYEIYAKLPASTGYWPAFWFWFSQSNIPNNGCWYNEIDVFEAYGCRPNAVESNAHWGFGCPWVQTDIGSISHACNYSTGYHWYGVEWSANKITWYVDRQIVRQATNIMGGIGIQNSMQIIINVALAPPWQQWENPINSSSKFPNKMYIDQANAYRLKCDNATVVNEIYNFNTFYYTVKKSITMSSATTIPSNSNISLKATDFIELKNGFEVPLGAELLLDITSCE